MGNKLIKKKIDNIFIFCEKNYKVILIVIILLGFFLRFYSVNIGFGANHYSKIDELEAYEWAQQLKYYGHPRFFTYIPGPYLTLLAFLLIRIFNTVKALYYFWVLLGTFSIYLIFWLSKKLFYCNKANDNLSVEGFSDEGNVNLKNDNFKIEYPNSLSLIITLIYAFYPWSIKYTISYWNPHFIIILSTLMLGYLFDILKEKNSKKIASLIIVISLMPFFHMIIIFTIPVILILILIKIKKVKLNFLYFFVGIIISILIWTPFFIFDKNNNFYILNSYLNHESFYIFHPETFKILVNPLLIITVDISRFIGHYFFEYKYFLDMAYGFYPIGLIPVFLSIILAIYSFIKAFKHFSIKKITKDNLNPITFLLFFVIGILFFHLLSLQVHEDRYTVIFFAVPFIILGYSFYELLTNENRNPKSKNFKLGKILVIFFIICILIAPYISISHFYQERYPNFDNKIRLVPSLIYYEQIKSFLIQDLFSELNIKDNVKDYIHFIDKDKVIQNLKYHSLLNYNFSDILLKFDKNGIKQNILQKIGNSNIKYFISMDNIYIEKDKARQIQIINCIKRFINENFNLIIDNDKLNSFTKDNNADRAKYKIYKLSFYPKDSKLPDDSKVIGVLPNAILIKTEFK